MNNQHTCLLSDRRHEGGFSVVKMLFWLALFGFMLLNGWTIFSAYYTHWQVEDVFENLASKMPQATEAQARNKLRHLFKVQYIDEGDLPPEFYDELVIKSFPGGLEISSWYSVTIWPFGVVEAVDENGEYDPEALSGMDALREKARIDLEFEPYAITSTGGG